MDEASCIASGCAQHSEHVGNLQDGHVCVVTPGGIVGRLQRRHACACGSGGGKGRHRTRSRLCKEYTPVGRGVRSASEAGGSKQTGSLDLGPGEAARGSTMLRAWVGRRDGWWLRELRRGAPVAASGGKAGTRCARTGATAVSSAGEIAALMEAPRHRLVSTQDHAQLTLGTLGALYCGEYWRHRTFDASLATLQSSGSTRSCAMVISGSLTGIGVRSTGCARAARSSPRPKPWSTCSCPTARRGPRPRPSRRRWEPPVHTAGDATPGSP